MIIELFRCKKCKRVYPLIVSPGGWNGSLCPHVLGHGSTSLGCYRLTKEYPYVDPMNTEKAHKEVNSNAEQTIEDVDLSNDPEYGRLLAAGQSFADTGDPDDAIQLAAIFEAMVKRLKRELITAQEDAKTWKLSEEECNKSNQQLRLAIKQMCKDCRKTLVAEKIGVPCDRGISRCPLSPWREA